MQRAQRIQRNAAYVAPTAETKGRLEVGSAGVGVANGRSEELEEAFTGRLARVDENRRYAWQRKYRHGSEHDFGHGNLLWFRCYSSSPKY